MIKFAITNLYLHYITNPNISEHNTLTSNEGWEERYDVILANPPFATPKGGIRSSDNFTLNSNRTEVLFVEYIMEHLIHNGKAGIIVPEGIIFQSGKAYKELRKRMVEQNYLWAVISLPSGVFQPYSEVKTSILLFDRELAKKTNNILFVKVESDGYELGAQRRQIDKNDLTNIQQLLRNYKQQILSSEEIKLSREDNKFINIILKSIISESEDYNLTADRYIVSLKAEGINKHKTCILKNFILESKERAGREEKYQVWSVSNKHGFINTEEYFNKQVASEDTKNYKLVLPDYFAYNPARINIGSIAWNNTNQVGIVSPMYVVFNVNREKLDPKFLFYLIKSNSGLVQVNQLSKGTIRKVLKFEDFVNIIIPLPPLLVQKEIVEELDRYQKIIDGARQVVENYKIYFNIDPNWKLVRIKDLFTTVSGTTPKSSNNEYYINGSIHWVKTTDLNNSYITSTSQSITPKAIFDYKLKVNPIGTVLIAMYGGYNQIGRTGILKVEAANNQALTALLPVSSILPEFLNYILILRREYWKKFANSTRKDPNITKSDILNFQIPCPSIEEQEYIVSKVAKENELIQINRELINIFEQKIKDRIEEIYQ